MAEAKAKEATSPLMRAQTSLFSAVRVFCIPAMSPCIQCLQSTRARYQKNKTKAKERRSSQEGDKEDQLFISSRWRQTAMRKLIARSAVPDRLAELISPMARLWSCNKWAFTTRRAAPPAVRSNENIYLGDDEERGNRKKEEMYREEKKRGWREKK